MSLLDAILSSATGMQAQSLRMNTVASNLANVDTTSSTAEGAYHAKMPIFQSMVLNANSQAQGVTVSRVEEDKSPVSMFYDPGNPEANKDGYVYGTNVSRLEQMTDMLSASQSYQADNQVANTCKELLMNTISMMKE